MRIPPISVFLSWPAPNYTDPETRGQALLIVNVIFATLVVIAVVGRFYSRLFIKYAYGWDDTLCIPSFVGLLEQLAC